MDILTFYIHGDIDYWRESFLFHQDLNWHSTFAEYICQSLAGLSVLHETNTFLNFETFLINFLDLFIFANNKISDQRNTSICILQLLTHQKWNRMPRIPMTRSTSPCKATKLLTNICPENEWIRKYYGQSMNSNFTVRIL